ncbi:hypothetical protein CoNPh14_CDS0167 [Staphylococcus phage S-CoN_Ph14]|nr:hypothetical protein CoNPh14_CDS0167 [Staphylococcus phage S-CoN_Ph14]
MIVYSKQTNLTKTRTFVHSEWTIFAFLWGFYMSEGGAGVTVGMNPFNLSNT